jgi:hypothetical protein
MGVDMKGVCENVSQLALGPAFVLAITNPGGKHKSSRIPKGKVYLKLRDKSYGLKARRGYKPAAAHKILVAIYHMFSHQVRYHELGDFSRTN